MAQHLEGNRLAKHGCGIENPWPDERLESEGRLAAGINATPASEIEIAHAEIATESEFEGVLQAIAVFAIQKRSFDVIKYSGHWSVVIWKYSCRQGPRAAPQPETGGVGVAFVWD